MMPPNLVSRYSPGFGETEIAGSRSGLKELVDFLEAGTGKIATDIPDEDASPYEMYLTGIEVRLVPDRRVTLSVDPARGVLDIAGSQAFLDVMASSIRGLSQSGRSDQHLHVDYFPDHFYLEPSEASLVIYLSGD